MRADAAFDGAAAKARGERIGRRLRRFFEARGIAARRATPVPGAGRPLAIRTSMI
jgi:hypothetical protein